MRPCTLSPGLRKSPQLCPEGVEAALALAAGTWKEASGGEPQLRPPASGSWHCAGMRCALKRPLMPLSVGLGTAPPRLPQPAAVSAALSGRPHGPDLPERRVGRCSGEKVGLLHRPPSGLSHAEGARPTPFPGECRASEATQHGLPPSQ